MMNFKNILLQLVFDREHGQHTCNDLGALNYLWGYHQFLRDGGNRVVSGYVVGRKDAVSTACTHGQSPLGRKYTMHVHHHEETYSPATP